MLEVETIQGKQGIGKAGGQGECKCILVIVREEKIIIM